MRVDVRQQRLTSRFVPAGVDNPQPGQFRKDRQRPEPFDRTSVLTGIGDDRPEKLCVLILVLVGVFPQTAIVVA